MENLKQAVKYFKETEGYNRLFKGIKNRYISLGEIKGNVTISKPTQEEKEKLSGLMKKDYSKNTTITINLKKLQKALNQTRFEGIELVDLLKEYFKEEILTKKENQEIYENDFNKFLNDILENNQDTYVYKYINKSIKEKDKLYMQIKKYYNKEKENLKQEILYACKAINNLPKEITRIPVFASQITSNPHGLDKKNLAGKIFISLICYIENTQYPKNSEELSELYYKHNLLVDDISSMVLCKNIKAFIKTEEQEDCTKYELHNGWQGFYDHNEPIFLTLYNLSNISYIGYSNYKKVVITENPAVFMGILEKCQIKDFPLICTYGQVKIAGLVLLDLLTKADYTLYYSGDLDPEGIQIADKLKQRYKEKLILLGFEEDIYNKNISNIELPLSRLQKLEAIKSKELEQICNAINRNKKAAYEEKNIDYIVRFIEKIVDEN